LLLMEASRPNLVDLKMTVGRDLFISVFVLACR